MSRKNGPFNDEELHPQVSPSSVTFCAFCHRLKEDPSPIDAGGDLPGESVKLSFINGGHLE
jgi:hypothetical protein